MEVYLIQEGGRRSYCSELKKKKKKKLKTKKLSKSYCIWWTEVLNKINRQNQSSVTLKLRKCIHQNLEIGHRSIYIYLKINTGCHAWENPSEETISENSQIRELHETIKLLTEEVAFSDASAKACKFKLR